MSSFFIDSEGFFEGEFPISSKDDSFLLNDEDMPDQIGILTLKNTVLFPGVVIPITVGRDKSIRLVKEANQKDDKLIGVVAQMNQSLENPDESDLYKYGTLAKILKMIKMPDGSITIVIQGRRKFQVVQYISSEPYFKAIIRKVDEIPPNEEQTKAITYSLKEEASRIIDLAPNIPSEAKIALENIDNLSYLVNFISANLNLDVSEKQKILEVNKLLEKCELVLQYLHAELQVLELSEEIQTKVKSDLDKQQREYILRQQIRAIQDELGEDSYESEIEELRARSKDKDWPKEVSRVFEKELTRLSRLNPSMPDYAMVINYIDWLLELPWQNYAEDHFDFRMVKEILDKDHYGLDKVKDRIMEHLAVLKLKSDKKAPILCFYGPPGVGKTSLGKSIAKALNKEFIRISLGGTKDEAEIRGHRRTYIGALPGRIIQGLKKAKTSNPVFMLDEVDKLGNDFRGNPSSALLEVLDPEQNNSFRDNFLEVEYDLSRVMFIATANTLATIQPALRDRMEIIQINSYSQEEKLEIAKRHLVPKTRKEHGLKAKQVKISDKALKKIIEHYTREPGVRKLNQQIAQIYRGVAKKIVLDEASRVSVTEKNLEDYLGIKKFKNELYQKFGVPGVAIGLAWSYVGGGILFIESTLTKGNGKLVLTGRLGEVMKESASLAYTYLQAKADQYQIPYEAFKKWDIHIHIPAGATPKEGPSAGITLLTTLASLFTQRLVKPSLAMTGEITLRGKVLPVGGIKEKVLAAVRAGISTIIMCKDNEKDVREIDGEYLKDLNFHFVSEMHEVLELALEEKQIPRPLKLVLSENGKTKAGARRPKAK